MPAGRCLYGVYAAKEIDDERDVILRRTSKIERKICRDRMERTDGQVQREKYLQEKTRKAREDAEIDRIIREVLRMEKADGHERTTSV